MTRTLLLLWSLSCLAACDARRSLEAAELARFPTGVIFEDCENAQKNWTHELPECLRVQLPMLGRGVCVPRPEARPDGARDAPRWGVWTYEYVRVAQTQSPDGSIVTHFRDLDRSSLGIAARGEYQDNQLEGAWTFRHLNGLERAHGNFRAGAMTGPWSFWLEDGTVDTAHTGVYANGVLSSPAAPK
ncbi:MAG: hypothetical protein JNL28_14985 [Planctomycetes bacterium]|nr:hypothetical protein [Planctomycetota bacterium]